MYLERHRIYLISISSLASRMMNFLQSHFSSLVDNENVVKFIETDPFAYGTLIF